MKKVNILFLIKKFIFIISGRGRMLLRLKTAHYSITD